MGLTNWSAPLCMSHQSVLQPLLGSGRTSPSSFQESLSDLSSWTIIFTDISTQGWGAHMGNLQIRGTLSRLARKLHINFWSSRRYLWLFVTELQGRQVMIATNNTTVVTYIKKQWGHGLTPYFV